MTVDVYMYNQLLMGLGKDIIYQSSADKSIEGL
jgi:hypothetical protein